jgi:DNA-binding SARP family transcriptional activator/tetratricopeptide (TPR) repeat protein
VGVGHASIVQVDTVHSWIDWHAWGARVAGEDRGALRIGVLGPLSAWHGDRYLRLPAGRLRIVLAMLALHHGESVSRDRLIDAVWGSRVPATAATQLQGTVSALRRLLPPGTIATDGAAYQLRVGPVALDLAEVQAAVDAARTAVREGRPEEAADRYRATLAVWRGEAFEGLDSPYLAAQAVRLHELRVVTVEEWAAVELGRGQPAAVLDVLTTRLASDPLREPLCRLLMTALYRTGRRAEALATFRTTRAALREALGVEPSPDLQDLHRRMLRDDPTLIPEQSTERATAQAAEPTRNGSPAPARESEATSKPAQLPPDMVDFTGRDDHVKHLMDLLTPARNEGDDARPGVTPVALVTGIGGVGKTALAVHVAHRLRARFPDGQLYVNLRGGSAEPVTVHHVAGRVLRDLGVEDRRIPVDVDERAAMYRSVLADRRLLIVLDEAADTTQVRPLLPASGASAVLVTSRRRLPGLAATRVQLDVLDPAEAARLFATIVGAERSSADPAAVDDVLAACGYLPLAVRIAASRLTVRPTWAVRDLADRLTDTGQRLDELAADDQQARTTFEVSYLALAPDQARAFRLLGLADLDEIPIGAAAALLDLDERTAERLTEALADVNLLHPAAPSRYRYHDLLRLYAKEQADRHEPPSEQDAARGRLLAWYHDRTRAATHAARPGLLRATDVRDPFPGPGQARAWLDREHRNITLTLIQCSRAPGGDVGPVEMVARTLHHIQWYLRARGHWDEWEQIAGAVLEAATRGGVPTAELTAHANLGQLAIFRGSLDQAHDQLNQALDLARKIGDRPAEGYALNRLGLLAHNQDRWPEAIDDHERALAIFTELDDRHGRCTALINLGKCHRELHQPRPALEALNEAARLARELADPESETMVLHHTACCQAELGNLDEAVAAHEECLALVRQLGQREGEGYTLAELGRTHLAAHRPAAAITHLREAIDIFRTLGDANAIAVFRVDLGHAYRQAGRADAARAAWADALRYFNGRDPAMTAQIRTLLAG